MYVSVSAVSVLHYIQYLCTRQEGGVSARVSAVFVSLAEKPVVTIVVRCTCALGGSSFSNVFKYINVL